MRFSKTYDLITDKLFFKLCENVLTMARTITNQNNTIYCKINTEKLSNLKFLHIKLVVEMNFVLHLANGEN